MTPTRIAMWSGPRSLSTAMMRAWENREDTVVRDEPLYAAYLVQTGLDHPMREEILASQPTDWRQAVAALGGPVPPGVTIDYQKHMAHHLLPGMDRGWLDGMRSCFLIRDPRAILASYVAKRQEVTLEDIGIPQLHELFDRSAQRTGVAPPVVLADDVQRDPEPTLRRLCAALDVPFSPRMLRWPPGRRDSDGVWAPHWYDGVERSTGFAPPRARTVELSEEHEAFARRAQRFYEPLLAACLR